MPKQRLYDLEDDSENLKELRRRRGSVGASVPPPPTEPPSPPGPPAGLIDEVRPHLHARKAAKLLGILMLYLFGAALISNGASADQMGIFAIGWTTVAVIMVLMVTGWQAIRLPWNMGARASAGRLIEGQDTQGERHRRVSLWLVLPLLPAAVLVGAIGVYVLLPRDQSAAPASRPSLANTAVPSCSETVVTSTLAQILRQQILPEPINTLAMGYPAAYGYNLVTSEVSFDAFRNRGEVNGVRTCLAEVYANYAGPRLKASATYTVELTDDRRQIYVTVIEVGR
ncbi:MAG: hypothetical protein JWQ89_1327 [Devosia sp.]|uniref:hypothetical protein n=1 Tax=Devosia sp. TaxID=1871048 RepID=UPI0026354FE6|nr:hypothetical protein [Devosia sp.]MDB5539600.1 hypothetical protein [Devosia sp.]